MGAKKYYQITSLGKQILANWINEPVTELPLNRDLFSLKLFFVTQKDAEIIEKLFNDQIILISDQLKHLKAREALLFTDESQIQEHYGHYLILKRAISRQEGQLAWLKTALADFK